MLYVFEFWIVGVAVSFLVFVMHGDEFVNIAVLIFWPLFFVRDVYRKFKLAWSE